MWRGREPAGDVGGSGVALRSGGTAMRSIVRRDTGESYEEFLRGLAKASGIETPTREELVRLDRKRKERTSNQEWKSPADEDARIDEGWAYPLGVQGGARGRSAFLSTHRPSHLG